MRILKLKPHHIPQVITTFQQELKESFLTPFGTKFLSAFFNTSTRTDQIFTFCVVKGKTVTAFATGTNNISTIPFSLLRHAPTVIFPLIKQVFLSPGSIMEYINWKTRTHIMDVPSRLLFFAVKKEYRRQGIGTILLDAVCTEFKRKKVKQFLVGVRKHYAGARAFYKKTGGKQIKKIVLPERTLIYYCYDLER